MPWRRCLGRLTAILALGLFWLGLEAWSIEARSAPFVRAEASALPATPVGLVLGCSPLVAGGRPNQFFVARTSPVS